MYPTTRSIAGGALMTCSDCGQAISMNKICKISLQSATDMLKHMSAHNSSRAIATASRVIAAEPETILPIEPAPVLSEPTAFSQIPN
jgi:hypothetical protein